MHPLKPLRMFLSTSRPTRASSAWRSTRTNGCPSMGPRWLRCTRGRNATKLLLTSSPSLTTPTTTCWWVRRGQGHGVEGETFFIRHRSLFGEGREVEPAVRRGKHACGVRWFGMTPLESCSKVIMWKMGVGQLLEVCNQRGVWWFVQGVEKYLKPLYGIRGELTAVCVVSTADRKHQQSSDLLRGKISSNYSCLSHAPCFTPALFMSHQHRAWEPVYADHVRTRFLLFSFFFFFFPNVLSDSCKSH